MAKILEIKIKNNFAIVSLSNPPLNALNQKLKKELLKTFFYLQKKENIEIILLKGIGKNFSVGADINEFKKNSLTPSLSDVCNFIEKSSKPVIAVLNGYILGGGLELALSAHLRIAFENSFFGFPEVNIGLLPGAGGTQRLPRLIGIKNSLEMILNGIIINEKKALKYGLIDKNILKSEDDLLRIMKPEVYKNLNFQLTSEKNELTPNNKKNNEILDYFKNNYQKNLVNLKILQSVKKTMTHKFDDGLKFEKKSFYDLKKSEESKSLIHVFFSERRTNKIPEIFDNDSINDFQKIGIIGAGKMGTGIAISCLISGKKVILIEKENRILLQSKKNIVLTLKNEIKKKRINNSQMETFLSSFTTSNKINSLKNVELVIEAISEDIDKKKRLFKELDFRLPREVFFATNTSYLSVTEIANFTSRPEKFIGLHFFSPANKMKLIEVIITEKVSHRFVHQCFNFAKSLKKIPVRSKDHRGFIGNSILSSYSKLIFYLVEDGMSPYTVDRILKKFGYPIGFHQMIDLAGGEISWSNRIINKKSRSLKERYVNFPDILCELGRFGQQTGKGYYKYNYDKTTKKNNIYQDKDVLKLIEKERKRKHIKKKKYSEDDFKKRYIAAIVNQAADLLFKKIVLRPSDIDIVSIYGYGFPKKYGGPMRYADTYGLSKILDDINLFHKENPFFWNPSPFLIEIVKKGKCFDDLN